MRTASTDFHHNNSSNDFTDGADSYADLNNPSKATQEPRSDPFRSSSSFHSQFPKSGHSISSDPSAQHLNQSSSAYDHYAALNSSYHLDFFSSQQQIPGQSPTRAKTRPCINPIATSNQPFHSFSRLSNASSSGSAGQPSELTTPTTSSSSAFFDDGTRGGFRERESSFFFGSGTNPPLSTIPTSPYTHDAAERKCWNFGMDMIQHDAEGLASSQVDAGGGMQLKGRNVGEASDCTLDPATGLSLQDQRHCPQQQLQRLTELDSFKSANRTTIKNLDQSSGSPPSAPAASEPKDEGTRQTSTSPPPQGKVASRLRSKNPKKLNLRISVGDQSRPTRKQGKRKAAELEEEDDSSSPTSPNTALSSARSTAPKEVRYVCSFDGCEKTFSTSGHAARHAKIHSGFKPYRCTFRDCGYRFDRRDNSLVHYKLHFTDERLSAEDQQRARQAWEDGLAVEVISKVCDSRGNADVEKEMVTEFISGVNSFAVPEPHEIREVTQSRRGQLSKPKGKRASQKRPRSSSVGPTDTVKSSKRYAVPSLQCSRPKSASATAVDTCQSDQSLAYSFATNAIGPTSTDHLQPHQYLSTFDDPNPFSTASQTNQSLAATSSHSSTTANPFKKTKLTPFSEPPLSEPSIFLDVDEKSKGSHQDYEDIEAICKQIDENQRKRSKTFSLSLPPLRDGNLSRDPVKSLSTYHYDFSRAAADAIHNLLNDNPSIKQKIPSQIVDRLSFETASSISQSSNSVSKENSDSSLFKTQFWGEAQEKDQDQLSQYSIQDWKESDLDFLNRFKNINEPLESSSSHPSLINTGDNAPVIDPNDSNALSNSINGSQSQSSFYSSDTTSEAKSLRPEERSDDYDPAVDQARLQSFNDAFSNAFGPGLDIPN